MKLKVYVAGPISNIDPIIVKENIDKGVDLGEILTRIGFNPFVPFLSYWWDQKYPHTWQEWLDGDFEWLHICDAMIVIPGPSKGREAEEEYAVKHNIPIFYSVKDLIKWARRKDKNILNQNDVKLN